MRLDDLSLWHLGDPADPRLVGVLKLVADGKGVSLHYDRQWLDSGFALSEDLPLIDIEFLPPGRLSGDTQRAVGAVDDARPDRWGEKVIRFVGKPKRLSLMEYLYYAGDDRFGALGVSTSSTAYTPRAKGPLPRLADAAAQRSGCKDQRGAAHRARSPHHRAAARCGAKPKALIDIGGEHGSSSSSTTSRSTRRSSSTRR